MRVYGGSSNAYSVRVCLWIDDVLLSVYICSPCHRFPSSQLMPHPAGPGRRRYAAVTLHREPRQFVWIYLEIASLAPPGLSTLALCHHS